VIDTRGAARDTEQNRRYLENCGAVQEMRADGETILFTFDQSKQPSDAPDGVYFDLSVAPF